MTTPQVISLDFRYAHGRRTFDVGVDSFTEAELKFLAETFAQADKGTAVDFNIGATDDGRRCMQFIVGKPSAKA